MHHHSSYIFRQAEGFETPKSLEKLKEDLEEVQNKKFKSLNGLVEKFKAKVQLADEKIKAAKDEDTKKQLANLKKEIDIIKNAADNYIGLSDAQKDLFNGIIKSLGEDKPKVLEITKGLYKFIDTFFDENNSVFNLREANTASVDFVIKLKVIDADSYKNSVATIIDVAESLIEIILDIEKAVYTVIDQLYKNELLIVNK